MKTKKILTLSLLLCFALTSCVKDKFSVKVTTGDANFSSENNIRISTFSATFDWRKLFNRPQGFGGVFYGKTSNLSAYNNLGTTQLDELADGTTFSIFIVSDINVGKDSRNQSFSSGDTIYYKAYAKVITDEDDIYYIYGEEKFTIVPEW